MAVGVPSPRPYDLRGSFVSLLARVAGEHGAAKYSLQDIALEAGHTVAVLERHYLGVIQALRRAKKTSPPISAPASVRHSKAL